MSITKSTLNNPSFSYYIPYSEAEINTKIIFFRNLEAGLKLMKYRNLNERMKLYVQKINNALRM